MGAVNCMQTYRPLSGVYVAPCVATAKTTMGTGTRTAWISQNDKPYRSPKNTDYCLSCKAWQPVPYVMHSIKKF